MHDPDALHSTPCCQTPEQRAAKLADYRRMHAVWLARNAPLERSAARWRRPRQILMVGLGVCVLVATTAGTYGLWTILNIGPVEWTARTVAAVGVGHIATAITVIRMVAAWRRRRGASAFARTADAAVSILPGR